jgi:hypothetical protein
MFKEPPRRALGINALLADESGNAFLSGSFLQAGSATPAGGAQAGDLVLAKETDAAAAPGAGFCVMKAVAGTNAGLGKLIARCGTSTTVESPSPTTSAAASSSGTPSYSTACAGPVTAILWARR